MALLKADEQTLELLERSKWKRVWQTLVKDWRLYVLLVPMLAFLILFKYLPIYGTLQAFKNYNQRISVINQEWYGLRGFVTIFRADGVAGDNFWICFRNTFVNSMYGLFFGFPIPIFIALFFTEIKSAIVRSAVQVCVYLPKFLSTIVTATIISVWTTVYSKVGVNEFQPGFLQNLFESVHLISKGANGHAGTSMLEMPRFFRPIYQVTGIWEGSGYGSIVYFAAALSVSPTNYEAAKIDGATKGQQIRYVTLPGMAPTLSIMLIIRIGQILNVGYEKVLLMYNEHTYETADVISTFVYRNSQEPGIQQTIGTAADIMNSLIAMCLVIGANTISRRVSSTSLF